MTMLRRLLTTGGTATFAAAALLMTPDLSLAQRHGGGGREGGGSHAGGGREGGGNWQRGDNGWRGGYGYGGYGYGGRGYGGYGSYGWGYPGYYGDYNWAPQYYGPGVDVNPGYATQPDYYSNEAAPEYADSAPVPGDRTYGNPMPGTPTTEDMNAARVDVRVPANAEVIFEGAKTTQRGSSRRFVSPPLTPGGNYSYDIEARWMENGRQVSRTRHVPVRAGQVVRVDFLRRESSDEAIEGIIPPHESTSRGRDNRPGTTNPEGTAAPGTPRPRTTPADGNLPGTTAPAGGTNPPPMPPK
jgi:uncharacterized protein (TIGR03000 family)